MSETEGSANYWLFSANPKTYFIVHYYLKDYVEAKDVQEDWWIIPKKKGINFRKKELKL